MIGRRVTGWLLLLASLAATSAQAAVVAFRGDGVIENQSDPLYGTPFSVEFAWETSVRPEERPILTPSGYQPGPVYVVSPVTAPLKVTGIFGTFVYPDATFSARFEATQTRLFFEYIVPPVPGPLRLAGLTITLPPVADPYGTDLPSDLSGASGRLTLAEPTISPALVGGAVVFAPTTAIPEPATWLLMAVAFAMVGVALRKRDARCSHESVGI